MRLFPHIHWARPAGRIATFARERCSCGKVRLVRVDGFEPVWWSRWHPTEGAAIGEAMDADDLGRIKPDSPRIANSWRGLWRSSGGCR